MDTLALIFTISLFIVFYSYLGYGMLLGLLVKLFGKKHHFAEVSDENLPDVALVVAAFNEQDIIINKIENSLALNYPQDKLHLYFVTDGSNDLTSRIVRLFPQVQIFHQDARKGKLSAVDRVMRHVLEPITIYTDANAMINTDAVRNMVRHFQNDKVGAVAGEKCVAMDGDATSGGEGIYWKYESLLKKWDYRLYSVVGAAGELFAIRTNLYEKPEPDTLIEDFVMTMRISAKGYRVAYEPQAQALESSSESLEEEMKRKVRISAGGLQAVLRLAYVLNPFKYGVLTFQYVSHRVLRWTLAPLSLMFLFVTNIFLLETGHWFWMLTMTGQAVFYIAAVAGWYLEAINIRVKALFVPLYFTFMNVNVYLGFLKLMSGNQSVVWSKAKRKS
ncbi:MAG: glycosyl transferase [Flammeovirgaceae bacterium]|nr:glycosyl transferase [Flammeovirgaceae bacterium]MBR06586.1 glycosyl transferase [Rickettsiales bacterium]|tara:strand:- start:1176 stop:2342 length:1167 start_codon:yes stop_codon:yes gene_type:complete